MAKSPATAKSTSNVVRAHETVALHDGALRLAVVADTHSAPHPRAAELIAGLRPDRILHAGDIGDLGVLRALGEIAPVSAVRGNIDVHAADLPDSLTLDVRDDGESLFKLLLLHIAVYGPKLRADAARLARAEKSAIVVCGHSHVPFIGRDRDLTIFNPGSIGPRRFHLPIVFGVLEVRDRRVSMRHVSCETGEVWMP
ncbi:MAG: putative phosphoesterase [Labilithrix sp.]|nr:putative phosphoesterase [Labilithrix sp.]